MNRLNQRGGRVIAASRATLSITALDLLPEFWRQIFAATLKRAAGSDQSNGDYLSKATWIISPKQRGLSPQSNVDYLSKATWIIYTKQRGLSLQSNVDYLSKVTWIISPK